MGETEKKSSSKECVQVVVRCRPFSSKEKSESRTNIIDIDPALSTVQIRNPQRDNEVKGFTFDSTYDETVTQRAFYEESCYPLVESVMEGFNGTIFAYGQTGCGKTHTMVGIIDDKQPELRGVIPNSFDQIFETIRATEGDGIQYLVRCSFLEIYNEEIRDLLAADTKVKCDLKEDPNRGVYVRNLTDIIVKNESEMNKIMDQGVANRTTGSTLMNAGSSRSHSIFTITCEANQPSTDNEETGRKDQEKRDHFRVGKLNLVDLAGSERQSKTGASGDRLKEGCKINMSLSALGNVISALVEARGKHIPYRDSKLTRLLQDSLGGNTKTLMVAAISPADYNYEETLSTLRYANRAKNIKNKPKINEDPKDAMLRQYKEEIAKLKEMLEGKIPLNPDGEGSGPEKIVEKQVEKEIEKIVEKKVYVEEKSEERKALEESNQNLQSQGQKLSNELQLERELRAQYEKKLKEIQSKILSDENSGFQSVLNSESDRQQTNRNINTSSSQIEQLPNDDIKERSDTSEAHKNISKEELEKLRADAKLAARQRKEKRKAQQKLKEKAKKEKQAKLEAQRVKEEKEDIEEELSKVVEENQNTVNDLKTAMKEQQKKISHLKKKMEKKIKENAFEMEDMHLEFDRERSALLETIREQNRELKLWEQVVGLFLPPKAVNRIWEKATWDDDIEAWRLPKIKTSNKEHSSSKHKSKSALPSMSGSSIPAPGTSSSNRSNKKRDRDRETSSRQSNVIQESNYGDTAEEDEGNIEDMGTLLKYYYNAQELKFEAEEGDDFNNKNEGNIIGSRKGSRRSTTPSLGSLDENNQGGEGIARPHTREGGERRSSIKSSKGSAHEITSSPSPSFDGPHKGLAEGNVSTGARPNTRGTRNRKKGKNSTSGNSDTGEYGTSLSDFVKSSNINLEPETNQRNRISSRCTELSNGENMEEENTRLSSRPSKVNTNGVRLSALSLNSASGTATLPLSSDIDMPIPLAKAGQLASLR